MISETVENIARMNIQERDTFVKTLVTKWPDLATSVNNMITLEQICLLYTSDAADEP